MNKPQDQTFWEGESDRWFSRNAAVLVPAKMKSDPVLALLREYGVRPSTALEIGAATGLRLAALRAECGCAASAVEPSGLAIAEGRRQHPEVTFVQSLASRIPLEQTFEVVILHFVLHWVDRSTLLPSIAEADRLLADGGWLVLGDFHPSGRLRVPYHHLPGQNVRTFKQDYASIFLATGLYHLVAARTFAMGDAATPADAGEDDRSTVWLLRKRLHDHYRETPRPA